MVSLRKKTVYLGLVPLSLGVAIGCITSALANAKKNALSNPSQPETPMNSANATPPGTGTPHVASGWQKKIIEVLEKEKWDQAWALYSEGGWSDAGQVIVMANQDLSRMSLRVVSANDREKAAEKNFSKAQWEPLAPIVKKAQNLSDVDEPMFDGLIFEYVHLSRGHDKALKVAKRIYIRATGRIPHKDHEDLIKAFQDLKGES